MKPLSISETKTAIQARIEGLEVGQVEVVNRLRNKGIPEELLVAAATAHEVEGEAAYRQSFYQRAEQEIITWFRRDRNLPEDVALSFLNGASGVRVC